MSFGPLACGDCCVVSQAVSANAVTVAIETDFNALFMLASFSVNPAIVLDCVPCVRCRFKAYSN
jgi:hypothetical protein